VRLNMLDEGGGRLNCSINLQLAGPWAGVAPLAPVAGADAAVLSGDVLAVDLPFLTPWKGLGGPDNVLGDLTGLGFGGGGGCDRDEATGFSAAAAAAADFGAADFGAADFGAADCGAADFMGVTAASVSAAFASVSPSAGVASETKLPGKQPRFPRSPPASPSSRHPLYQPSSFRVSISILSPSLKESSSAC
jgi:hypothetical protein